jgi:hypothetical protein
VNVCITVELANSLRHCTLSVEGERIQRKLRLVQILDCLKDVVECIFTL